MPRKPKQEKVVMSLGQTETVSIDNVKPYWRNPRRVTEEAVNALRSSITEFGYSQPIVVDDDYVIIVGHTRYAALRRMGVTQIPVKVARGMDQALVKQYRLIDNKAAELTSWDYERLVEEMEGLDSSLLTALFPEIKDSGAEAEQQFADTEALRRQWESVVNEVDFVCPSCYHEFEATVTKEAILSGVIRATDTEPSEEAS